jgi:hypothetical protein
VAIVLAQLLTIRKSKKELKHLEEIIALLKEPIAYLKTNIQQT